MIPRPDLRWTTSFVLLLTAACSDRDLPTSTPIARPALTISDGANGGNSHFFFLPPIVPAPAPTGTFDAAASPEVRICEWNGASCAVEIAAFSLSTGTGGELVKVDLAGQQYHVNWHTNLFALDLGAQYRIRVLLGGQELGHADVNPVSGGQGLKNVDTGEYIALKDGSTLPIKFRIEVGAVVVPEGPTFSDDENQSVASGALHTCALSTSGAAHCWGDNTWGELGTGATGLPSSTPVAVIGGHTFIALVAMGGATCGLESSGAALCWGANGDGQLGRGTMTAAEPTPQPVAGGHTFAALSAGAFQVCGRTTAGEIWCWGYGILGQLGNGAAIISPTPVKAAAPGNPTFKSISGGIGHFCGLTTAGVAYCWGGNGMGQLGLGFAGAAVLTPTVAASGYTFESIVALGNHTCGLTAAGAAYCWGWNEVGQLGRGTFSWSEPAIAPVGGGLTFVRLSGAAYTTCGLTATGTAYCWGGNDSGQLGMGTASGDPNEPDWWSATPVAVTGGNVFSTIDVAQQHTCAITPSGIAKCWGSNLWGQLGNADPNTAPSPVAVAGGITWAAP